MQPATNTTKLQYDWQKLARLALTSRMMDDLEEEELTPQGEVVYQFSARGHELGQLLVSQLLDHSLDGASVYYRSRPFMLGSGMSAEQGFANGMARAGSMSEGRDVGVVVNMPSRGGVTVLPMAGDVGSQYTPAAGWAQAIRYRVEQLGEQEHAGSIAVVFGGDGSVATNGFWSALTIATTLKLPMLFFIEDNEYAISVKNQLQTPGGVISDNLASFKNLEIADGDGTEPLEAATLVRQAVSYVRQGDGPFLLRLSVPRLSGHSSVDNQAYKSKAEQEAEWQRDPLPKIRDYLIDNFIDADEWDQLEQQVEQDVRQAAAQARERPQPTEATTRVFAVAERIDEMQPAGGGRRINMVQAVKKVLDVELARNPKLIVFGEDVGAKGGVHTATMGLQSKFGEGRVFDTSLSEEGIVGRAVGMALAGLRPCPEIQFRKYADPATEQLHNLGSLRWRTHGRFEAPVVVRVAGGFGRKIGDPWHSVTNEAMFAHAVGWQVAFPSNAEDCVGLLRTALRSPNPTLFFEHRAQLDAAWARRPYPGDDYVVPFGKARLINSGDDLTVVTWGAMVERCEEAANRIDAAIEIIDLRTIMPWDKDAVLQSVRKTSKVIIVHEDIQCTGFGAEVAAVIAEEAFMDLDGPVTRVAAAAAPIPFNIQLMDQIVPSVDQIEARMRELLAF